MSKSILLLILLPFWGIGQKDVISNYRKAFEVLQTVNDTYGYADSDNSVVHVKYSGVSYESGHFSYPERHYADSVSFSILSNNSERYAINKDLLYKEKHYFSQFLLANDSCFTTDYWSERKWNSKTTHQNMKRFYLPINLVKALNDNKHSLHFLAGENETNVLGFNDLYGNKYYVSVEPNKGIIQKVIQLGYDQIYGDNIKEIRYENSAEFSVYPTEIFEFRNNFMKESLKLVETDLPLASSDSLQLLLNENSNSEKNEHILCEKIAPTLYLLKLQNYGNKILVSEHDSYMSIYDAPGSIHVGNELITFLKERFNKPVKYCFISHHHPDHGGAVAAFNEIGAEIITTPKNVPFFKKVCAVDHTIGSPSIVVSGKEANYIAIDSASNQTFFKKSLNEVVCYEMGATSHHTEEYLLFYFPKDQILFVPDLVMFPIKGNVDQKGRAYSIYECIKKNKLKISGIYTGWPLKGYKEFGTMDDLKESLRTNYPDIK